MGATLDFGLQVGVNMTINNQDFGDAVKNVDYTSVAASAAMGAVAVPGINTGIRFGVIITSATMDATTDTSQQEGVETIFDETKPPADVVIDGTASIVGSKATGTIVESLQKNITRDITSGAYSTLNKTQKNVLDQTSKIINNNVTTKAIESVIDYSTTATSEAFKNTIGGNSLLTTTSANNNTGVYVPVDAVSNQKTTFIETIKK